MVHNCFICGNTSFSYLYNELLIQCDNCSFVTANVQGKQLDFKSLYDENYFMGNEYENYLESKNSLQKNFLKRIQFIEKKIPVDSIQHALELGCAYGFFGELFKKHFPHASYKGFDISESAVNYAKENYDLDVSSDDFLESTLETKFTDVFAWDLIEHLEKPDDYLAKLVSITSENARIYLTTGDIARFLPRIQKEKWRMIHPPTHLHYFSKKTITHLLNKHGFKIISINYPSVYRNVSQTFFSLFILGKKKNNFKSKMYRHINKKWYFAVNTCDIMFVIAEKK
jgi:cyclopropane fatty-acyl-phospholipid synthase-like methyltransferase